jgi:hypothetical protein
MRVRINQRPILTFVRLFILLAADKINNIRAGDARGG